MSVNQLGEQLLHNRDKFSQSKLEDRLLRAILPVVLTILLSLSGMPAYAGEAVPYQRPSSTILKPCDQFDFYKYTRERAIKFQPVLEYRPGSDFKKWQATARAKFRSMLVVPNQEGSPIQGKLGEKVLCSVVIDKKQYKYTRQEVLFYTRPNFPACGYLLLPFSDRKDVKFPAIICIPGHGSRVEDIIGLNQDGSTRNYIPDEYQHDLAVQCIAHGFAAFAIEPLGSGGRKSNPSIQKFPRAGECKNFSAYLSLLGETLMGYRVYDVMRAYDFLQSQSNIAKDKIATMGISSGAAISMFAAAIDPRIKVTIASGYLSEMEESLLTRQHCICHYIPNLAKTFRLADLAGLVAPRLLILETTKDDSGFPMKGALTAFADAKEIYTASGSPDQIIFFKTQGNHLFSGVEAFKKLEQLFNKDKN